VLTQAHERVLRQTLGAANAATRVGFAAACAERLFASIEADAPPDIRRALLRSLATVWACAKRRPLPAAAELDASRNLRAFVHADDSLDGSETGLALQDAIAASVYALKQVASDEPTDAVWAARQLTDAVDRRLQANLEAGLSGDAREQFLQNHPALQAEVERQQEYLMMIIAANGDAAALEDVRRKSREDGRKL
jgi:hypothetical protein